MKHIILLFLTFSISNLAFSQESKKNVDYQYLRNGDEYHAYSALVNAVNDSKTLELQLVSTYKIDRLNEILIKENKKQIKISFSTVISNAKNDDKSLQKLSLLLDAGKILKNKFDCDTEITFVFNNGQQITFPFNSCLIKESLKP